MVIVGQVQNGQVVFAAPPGLADGATLQVEATPPLQAVRERLARARREPDAGPTLAERLAPIMGTGHGLPADLAARHDSYLRGAGE